MLLFWFSLPSYHYMHCSCSYFQAVVLCLYGERMSVSRTPCHLTSATLSTILAVTSKMMIHTCTLLRSRSLTSFTFSDTHPSSHSSGPSKYFFILYYRIPSFIVFICHPSWTVSSLSLCWASTIFFFPVYCWALAIALNLHKIFVCFIQLL